MLFNVPVVLIPEINAPIFLISEFPLSLDIIDDATIFVCPSPEHGILYIESI